MYFGYLENRSYDISDANIFRSEYIWFVPSPYRLVSPSLHALVYQLRILCISLRIPHPPPQLACWLEMVCRAQTVEDNPLSLELYGPQLPNSAQC